MRIDIGVRVSKLELSQIKDEFRRLLCYMDHALTFEDNFNCALHTVVFDTPDTDVTVSHGLGRVPTFYLYTIDSKGYIYDGTGGRAAWTSTELLLKSSVAATATVLVF